MKYKLIIDYGKPYELEFKDLKSIKKHIESLKERWKQNVYPYCDIIVFQGNKEITRRFFK